MMKSKRFLCILQWHPIMNRWWLMNSLLETGEGRAGFWHRSLFIANLVICHKSLTIGAEEKQRAKRKSGANDPKWKSSLQALADLQCSKNIELKDEIQVTMDFFLPLIYFGFWLVFTNNNHYIISKEQTNIPKSGPLPVAIWPSDSGLFLKKE